MSDLIACDGCGRSFKTDDGVAMLAAIKGPCPSCGSTFQLASYVSASSGGAQPPPPPAQRR
jgi:rRNA maturation endonuclease Nob1